MTEQQPSHPNMRRNFTKVQNIITTAQSIITTIGNILSSKTTMRCGRNVGRC